MKIFAVVPRISNTVGGSTLDRHVPCGFSFIFKSSRALIIWRTCESAQSEPLSFSPSLLFHRNARADTICVCADCWQGCGFVLGFYKTGKLGRSPLKSLWRVAFNYPIAYNKTSLDLSAVIIAKYRSVFRLHLERSFNQFIHWNLNLGGIIFVVRSGP